MDKSYIILRLDGVQCHVNKTQYFFNKEEIIEWCGKELKHGETSSDMLIILSLIHI